MTTYKWFCSISSHALSALILLVSVSYAASPEIQTAEFSGTLKESHDAQINASSNVIVGLMGSGAYLGLQKDRLLIQTGEFDEPASACLQVTSRDGAYHSSNPYMLDSARAAVPTHIPYPTKYPQVINSFTANDVGITITTGECNENSLHYLIPSAEPDLLPEGATNFRMTPGTIFVLVNGFEATDVFFEANSPEKYNKKGDCTYIEEGLRTAFNYICELTDVPDAVTDLSLSLFREVYGRSLPEISVDISTLN